jgi:hypothetical protein
VEVSFLLFIYDFMTHTHARSGEIERRAKRIRSSFISGSSFLCNFHVIIFHPQFSFLYRPFFAPSSRLTHPRRRVHVCIYYCTKVVYSSNKNPPSLCSTLFFFDEGEGNNFSLRLPFPPDAARQRCHACRLIKNKKKLEF